MNGPLAVSYVVLWVLFLVIAVVLIGVLRNLGVLLSKAGLDASVGGRDKFSLLERGQELPNAQFESSGGGRRMASDFRGGKTAFAIVSPSCEACSGFIDVSLEEGPDPLDPELRNFTVITLGNADETKHFLDQFTERWPGGMPEFLIDQDGEVARKWGLSTTPAAVIVDAELRMVRQVIGGRPRPKASGRKTRAGVELQSVARGGASGRVSGVD